MIEVLLSFFDLLFTVLTFAILARALISWFPMDPDHPIVQFLYQITEPILAPLRRFVPAVGMMDITPIVALILLQVLQVVVHRILLIYLP